MASTENPAEVDTVPPGELGNIALDVLGNENPSLSGLQYIVYHTGVSKGWWKDGKNRNIGEMIALIHSEVSEALEEYRKNPDISHVYYSTPSSISMQPDRVSQEMKKPEGFVMELADAVIRIMDLCEAFQLDLSGAIQEKAQFNLHRAARHGGKTI